MKTTTKQSSARAFIGSLNMQEIEQRMMSFDQLMAEAETLDREMAATHQRAGARLDPKAVWDRFNRRT